MAKDPVMVNNLVVVSDTHCGCRLGLCPPGGVFMDEGGMYKPSKLQKKIWKMWREFWDEFVPLATRGEPYAVVFNGDIVDGVHHGSTTQISHNLEDQAANAYECMAPIVEACEGRYYHIRGTEAHVGKSARDEENLAKRLGAIPNEEGQHARWDLWKMCGPKLVHFLHHVGTTSSAAYEATAVFKELIEEYVESAKWDRRPPDAIIRSHRHRYIMCEIPTGRDASVRKGRTSTGHAIAAVTGCWQGKTPFVWKIAGARLTTPQFGGLVVRYSDEELFVRKRIWTVERSKVE